MTDLINHILRKQPKIKQIDILYDNEHGEYACVVFCDKFHNDIDILLSPIDLQWLLYPIHVNPTRKNPYIRIRLDSGRKYLHRLVSGEVIPSGWIRHHVSFSTDNRRQSLQTVPLGIHSRFHRNLNIAAKFPSSVFHGATDVIDCRPVV